MLDDTKEEKTIKLLETAVLLMEGASEEDVKLINSGSFRFLRVKIKFATFYWTLTLAPAKKRESKDESGEGGDGEKPENADDKKRDKFRWDFWINFGFHIGCFSRHDDSDDEKSDKNDTKDSSKDDEEEGIFSYGNIFLLL